MTALIWILLGLVLAVAFAVCWSRIGAFRAQRPIDYDDTNSHFDLRKRLNGPIACEGVIYGPLGRVTSRFVAKFDVNWNGNTAVMKEVFHYDSGSIQHREWRLTLSSNGRILALADDVVGQGAGWQKGSAVQLKYKFRLPEDAGGHVLNTVDWMYLIDNGTIMNRSQFYKFGFKVAELVATMRPLETETKVAA